MDRSVAMHQFTQWCNPVTRGAELQPTVTAHPAQEKEFRQLLDAAPDAMVVVDPRGSVVALNREAERSSDGPRQSYWASR